MIKLLDKNKCCGCGACSQVCPKKCINMESDNEGFLYPIVDETLCINCFLCEKVCPAIHPYDQQDPKVAYAAINKDEEVRLASSSGGVFTIFAQQVISDGGVVFGAQFNDSWLVELAYTETTDGIKRFQGSKYVQASTNQTYCEAKKFLDDGRPVLFSGTPCQIAGLKHFLRKDYDNLLAVDLICHGAPSPKVWKMYLEEVTENSLRAVKECKFRNKDNGWKQFNFQLEIENDNDKIKISSYHWNNHFMQAFLSDMILRPSCYNCRAKCGRSHSDITLADFWGIQSVLPDFDDDKGTGLVLINTEKGEKYLSNKAIYQSVNSTDAINYNPAWKNSASPHTNREKFFEKLDQSTSIIKLINNLVRPKKNIKQQLYDFQLNVRGFIWNFLHGRINRGGI